MSFESWSTIVGFLLLGMAFIPSRLGSLPLTTSLIYLFLGLLLGDWFLEEIPFSPLRDAKILERVTEIAVLISLFTAGLKLRLPFSDGKWKIPLRLAFVSMAVTVGLITLVGVHLLSLPLGAAVLLGAILAPTDPVLASDVQVEHTGDDDRLRFSLTGEAGFNDGTAFPFVMLGLGLLGLHDLGAYGWRWLAVDVLWSITGGLAIGAMLGFLVARLVIYLRSQQHEAIGTDDFVALGLIAGTYGIALFFHTYGFLAVFAAGLALRHIERTHSERSAPEDSAPEDPAPERAPEQSATMGISDADSDAPAAADSLEVPADDVGVEKLREELAAHPDRAASFMAREVLRFNESLERIAELGLVVLLGGMLSAATWTNQALWFAPLLFLLIRPLSIFIGLFGTARMHRARPYIAWFGIRGIGSLYYLFYAIHHGLAPDLAQKLTALTFSVIALSILVHGVSVTPLMKIYNQR